MYWILVAWFSSLVNENYRVNGLYLILSGFLCAILVRTTLVLDSDGLWRTGDGGILFLKLGVGEWPLW
jgi:hypothetical protein